MDKNPSSKPTVFISYSHKDEAWLKRLVSQLGVLEKQRLLDHWDDTRIGPGKEWRKEIEAAINKAVVAILLVSADFLTSDFILNEEVPLLLQRREKEGLWIFPIIVRPCNWEEVQWLSPVQVRPKLGKPLSIEKNPKIESDLRDIAKEVLAILRLIAPQTNPVGQ